MWYLVSSFTLYATFYGNSFDFSDFFLPKDTRIVMTTSPWNSNISIFCFCTVKKRFHAFFIKVFTAKSHSYFFDLCVDSICGHKLIEQIHTNHLLVAVLKRFWHWKINSFLGWLWPPLSCAEKIAGNIVGGATNNFVIQPRHCQNFTIGIKIIKSSGFLY